MPNISSINWRCRRGKRELDLILASFLDRHLDTLSEADVGLLDRLLDASDDDLLDWVLGREAPAPEFEGLIARMPTVVVRR